MNRTFYPMTFGRFQFDPETLELRRDGAIVPLQQQPARVLALLLARPGGLVTREELRQAIWGEDTFVDFDRGLNFCVSQIRAALGDDPHEPRYVETLRGRGYRFVATLRHDAVPNARAVAAASLRTRMPGRTALWIAAAALVMLAPLAWTAATMRGETSAVSIAPFEAGGDSRAWSANLRAQLVAHLAHGGVRVIDAASGAARAAGGWTVDARVDRSVEQYRVTVTLRDETSTVRWSDIFDGPPGDWIEAQNEMARIISQAIRYHVEGPQAVNGIERRVPRRKIPFS